MPEPLLSFELYPKLVDMARKKDFNGVRAQSRMRNNSYLTQRFQMMPLVTSTLKDLDLLNFKFLFLFLKEATFYSGTSRMDASNVALVFAPNILRPVVLQNAFIVLFLPHTRKKNPYIPSKPTPKPK